MRNADPVRDFQTSQTRPGRHVVTRREGLLTVGGLAAGGMLGLTGMLGLSGIGGCVATGGPSQVDRIWGRRGFSDGRFLKPRAITIDPLDQLYIVDTTGRIQVFDADGNHRRTWNTLDTANGRPTGLAFDATDAENLRLLVADTHYYRMLVYSPDGELQADQQVGGESGFQPGQFAFVTDAVNDRHGNLYIGEYGASDRIQKFTREGEFVTQWGGTGSEPGQFLRPQSLVVDGDSLWIADACNHRIARYDLQSDTPEMMGVWGTEGDRPGQLHYPYDLAIDQDGTVIVCEYGNQRLQRFTPEGNWLSSWGSPGHSPGQLYQPWGVVIDSMRRVHVLDSNNHRVQRLVTL